MGTFSTNINIATDTTLPVILNSTIVNNYAINGNFAEYGKLVLSAGTYRALSTEDCGPGGAIVYAQSLTSNAPGTAIKLYVSTDFYVSGSEYYPISESIQSFATLYPGDTATLPITPQQKGLIASVTQDSATLDYYIGDRGGEYGHNVSIMVSNNTNYEYFIMDAELGETTPMIDTGLAVADWTYSTTRIVNNKGYINEFTIIA